MLLESVAISLLVVLGHCSSAEAILCYECNGTTCTSDVSTLGVTDCGENATHCFSIVDLINYDVRKGCKTAEVTKGRCIILETLETVQWCTFCSGKFCKVCDKDYCNSAIPDKHYFILVICVAFLISLRIRF